MRLISERASNDSDLAEVSLGSSIGLDSTPANNGDREPEHGGTRLTGFEPVTFGFVDRSGGSAGLRGARFQANSARSRPAEIGWNLRGMLPQLLPQRHAPSRLKPKVKRPIALAAHAPFPRIESPYPDAA
jgi:hypothetical protein